MLVVVSIVNIVSIVILVVDDEFDFSCHANVGRRRSTIARRLEGMSVSDQLGGRGATTTCVSSPLTLLARAPACRPPTLE